MYCCFLHLPNLVPNLQYRSQQFYNDLNNILGLPEDDLEERVLAASKYANSYHLYQETTPSTSIDPVQPVVSERPEMPTIHTINSPQMKTLRLLFFIFHALLSFFALLATADFVVKSYS
jgi:hypothetical protein